MAVLRVHYACAAICGQALKAGLRKPGVRVRLP
jgi:hypothetical protein